MDGYGRARREGSRPDPYREWGASGQETGLEEGVWQLRLGAEGESGYPERPEEPNCIYYLRTGFCGYGSRCRFNHPRDRAAVLGAARGGGGEFPERAGQPVCQYYIRTGGCKFGASCKYHHPKEGGGAGGSSSSVQLNYYGYPLRPGEKECTYYLKTGQCKFADTCKFHHPMPANVQIMVQPPESQVVPGPPHLPPSVVYSPVQSPAGPSSQQYGIVVRPSLFPGFVSAPYGPFMLSHGVYPSWAPYPAPATPIASPGTQLTVGSGTMYGLAQLSPSSPGYTNAYLPAPASVGPSSSTQKENPFPERHGQPECQYYMKTGDCKYGSSCRYHHPPELITPTTNVVLSPMGLPLRPDAPPCMHYAQRGQCKFGAACRFDHPMGTLSYSPSASSLTDMPVAPYPVGSSMGTLAPSSSSSDLRPELVSGSTMGSGLTRMSSSTNTQLTSISSSLAASPLTKSENVPQLSVHQPNQGAAPSSSSSSNLESHCAS